jgi:phosphoglycolate phosphatase-like HAD superfamily hydrolase
MSSFSYFTAANLPRQTWLKIINPSIHLGCVRHALFDFDGTISLIRRGWEDIMIPMMIEMICGENTPSREIIQEVEAYVDHSTGILTIEQMRWLVLAVARHSLNSDVKTAYDYKKMYNERLLQKVRQRIRLTTGSQQAKENLITKGARLFLETLVDRGIILYLASGTDHQYVLEEAHILGIDHLFRPHIYGAVDKSYAHTKERIIKRIIAENNLKAEELVVIGDGPVEIRHAKSCGALAIGVAVDEANRQGFNRRKLRRLQEARADLIIDGFEHHRELVSYLCGG